MESFDEAVKRVAGQRDALAQQQHEADNAKELKRRERQTLADQIVEAAGIIGRSLADTPAAREVAKRGSWLPARDISGSDARPSKWNIFGNHYGPLTSGQERHLREQKQEELSRLRAASIRVWYVGSFAVEFLPDPDNTYIMSSVYLGEDGKLYRGRQPYRDINSDVLQVGLYDLSNMNGNTASSDVATSDDILAIIRDGLADLAVKFDVAS